MTRFEKVKEMTVEEVADWLENLVCCDFCPVINCSELSKDCKARLTEYLNGEEPEVCGSCAIDFAEDE